MVKIHLDFETLSVASLPSVGAHVYSAHPTTDLICVAFAFGNGPVELWVRGDDPPIDLLMIIEEGDYLLEAHNVAFEMAIWVNVCVKKYGWPPLDINKTSCTMARGYVMALPGKLKDIGDALDLDVKKDMEGHGVMLRVSQPRKKPKKKCRDCNGSGIFYSNVDATCPCVVWWNDEKKLKIVYEYCKDDVRSERELSKRLPYLSSAERETWLLDQKINNRGVYLDIPCATSARVIVDIEKKRLKREMQKISRGKIKSCNTVEQIINYLADRGIDTPNLTKLAVVTLLEQNLPKRIRKILLLRQRAAKTSTAKLKRMMLGTSADNRARGCFQYHLAGTGRWASRRIQFQNIPRPKIKQEEIEMIFKILQECAA